MIPEGWQRVRLSDLAKSKIVYGIVQAGAHDPHGVPYLKSSDVGGQIYPQRLQRTSIAIHSRYHRSTVRPGDIVISLRGNTGSTSIVPPELPEANLTQGTARISVTDRFDRDFVYQQIASSAVQRLIHAATKGSTFVEITLDDLRKIELLCPPTIQEQRRIAEILTTWDRAIETVEALIANARAQKQALMQQLLPKGTTPPIKRLPGFSGEWQRVPLADIGTISSAGVDKNINEGEAEVRLLNFLDAYNREFIYNSDLDHRVTAPTAKVQGCNVRKGDVFFTPSSETRDDIALAAVAAEDMPGVVYSYHVVRFRPTEKLDLKFCAFVFQTDDFKRQAYRLGDGSGQRYVISQSNFRKMLVSLPRIDEQVAIGELLADHSTNIADYETQLSALREEKAALMQQLLTGKRRVKLDHKEAA